MPKSKKTLRVILGDQLNINHSWFKEINSDVTYLMMETLEEATYVKHHIQKIVGFFASMRNFANLLQKKGHHLFYIKLNDAHNHENFKTNIETIFEKNGFDKIEFLYPDEYRIDNQLNKIVSKIHCPIEFHDSEHFFTQRDELKLFFENKKSFLMETFYRQMRKKHYILMDGDKPIGGQWNFDADNRKKLPKSIHIPPALTFNYDALEIVNMITEMGIKTIGTIDAKNFMWPTSRNEAIELLNYFCDYLLPYFGTYEDAMHTEHWSVFHSRLSFVLNIKLISPKEVIDAAVKAWENNKNEISIAQIEGFVRQILGWREYMRGIYWAKMPEYEKLNFFNHQQKLPDYFWTGDTKMNCVKHAVKQSLSFAYAHHIQRLMVTGNFMLLAGIHPDEVDEWYLGIYIDALQWVEITNTRGMSQFADGGIVGSKPYVSSANYIDKMSNYCEKCFYNKSKKYGEKACPFNSFYWDFYDRHESKLRNNPRIGMMYNIWGKTLPEEKSKILEQAAFYHENLNQL